MDPLLITTRALHFAGALSLAGVLGFVVFIAGDLPPRLTRQLRIAAQLSAMLVLVTAPLWLILVAENMSADTLTVTIASFVPKTVLLDTRFGHALGLRFVLTLLLLPLMFIGTGPGGMGGGLKITTLVVLLATVASAVRGSDDVVLPFLRRRISPDVGRKAVAALILSIGLVGGVTIFICDLQPLPPLAVIFEVVSAFSTTGLSTGVTARLSTPGKLLITLLMFAGRIGPLTLALAISAQAISRAAKLPEERVLIG